MPVRVETGKALLFYRANEPKGLTRAFRPSAEYVTAGHFPDYNLL